MIYRSVSWSTVFKNSIMILCDVPSGTKEIAADTDQDTPLAVTHTLHYWH